MKNSIILLGITLLSFVNVSATSNTVLKLDTNKNITIKYEGVTPLCVAISKGELEIVKKFIEYGADVNQLSNGLTPLMIAARYNKIEIIKYLLDNCNVKINLKDSQGLTALNYAEISNATESIDLLRNHK